jgi:hypothetical protein
VGFIGQPMKLSTGTGTGTGTSGVPQHAESHPAITR